MACQMHNNMPIGQCGIVVSEIGPWDYGTDGEEKWQLSYIPAPTDQCDLCAARTAKGELPTCVHHCQAKCLTYGKLEDLYKQASDHPKQVVYAIA
jgi:Fe-S-cluster-containing dehydrogenase component